MKPFSDACRFDYLLDENSLVLDCGGYEGNFAKQIYDKFKCRVMVFEPMPDFYARIKSPDKAMVSVHNMAVGGTSRVCKMSRMGDMSGAFVNSDQPLMVPVIGIESLIEMVRRDVDLLKLNIEGMEYEVLEAILDRKLSELFIDIQVQFHRIPDAVDRIKSIREGLSKTHDMTYCDDFVFENWSLKP